MSPAARSVTYFGFYLYAIGLALIFFPNVLLEILQLPQTREAWIRIIGVLAFNIGFYYHRTGIANNYSFFRLTIPTRMLVFAAFAGFVLMGYASPIILGFGAIDLCGALWTWRVLRKR